MNRLSEHYKNVLAQTPTSLTITTNGPSIDLGPGFLDDLMVTLLIGAVSGTTPTLDVTVETSADEVTWTQARDVDGNLVAFPQYTDADADTVKTLGLNINGQNDNGDDQRYARPVFTIAGTTPDFTVGALFTVESDEGSADLNDIAAL